LALIEGDPPPDDVESGDLASTAWSHSRRGEFENCPRRYYFEYYGASKHAARDEPAKDDLRVLKEVKNRHLRTGEILHENIAWYLRGCQQSRPPEADHLVARARQQLAADRAYSLSYANGSTPILSQDPSLVLLQEYLYLYADADALYDEADAKLIAALGVFTTDPQCLNFHLGASTPGALIERPVNFRPAGVPCRVMGKIDFAYGGFETATLVDWKLGEDDGRGDDSLQLAVYALWAIAHFGCDPSEVRVCKVHLGSKSVVDFSTDERVLANARARITQDALRMVAVHRYGKDGIAEAFAPRAQRGICRGCSFLRMCPAGRKALDD
jgi:hypothetical protein